MRQQLILGNNIDESTRLRRHLYAAVLAQACNLGPTRMARISDLTYQKLARCTNWYLRPATVRDATYVLDEILDNETELPLLEHTTDTAGYTEIVFALFDLLGLQFSPRIRDLGDQRLFRLDRQKRHPHWGPLLKGRINRDRILRHWDELLRVAGSLKRGWVTASLLIGKLQSYPRKNRLTRTLQEYGRLIKTIFILRYLESEQLRRRIAAAIPYPCSDHRQDFFGGCFRRTSLLLESMRRFEGVATDQSLSAVLPAPSGLVPRPGWFAPSNRRPQCRRDILRTGAVSCQSTQFATSEGSRRWSIRWIMAIWMNASLVSGQDS